MKYVEKDMVENYEGEKADVIAKPDFDKKGKAMVAGGLGAIALGIYAIAKSFFKAGCVGYNIGEYEALDSLGLIGGTTEDGRKIVNDK